MCLIGILVSAHKAHSLWLDMLLCDQHTANTDFHLEVNHKGSHLMIVRSDLKKYLHTD